MRRVVYDQQVFSLQPYGGASRYFCELAARVARSADIDVNVVAPVHSNRHLADSTAPTFGKFLPRTDARYSRVARRAARWIAPLAIKASRPDLVHKTYYGGSSRFGRAQVAITVFDMIHELFGQHFSANDPTVLNKRESVRSADLVICISHSTARDLQQLLDVPTHKIVVTHLGCSDAFVAARAADEHSPHARPYLLYVGQRAGYKNFGRFLAAFASSVSLRGEFDVIAFGGGRFDDEELQAMKAMGLDGQVQQTVGDDALLARLYRHAVAFVYPSLYEGFGIPLLEAMACGCPVVCSNTSSMPEVVGDAAATFDPADEDSMRTAIETVCVREDIRRRSAELGPVRAREFSWDLCAARTADAYRITLDRAFQ